VGDSRSLTSLISCRWLASSRLMSVGTLKAIILYVRVRNSAFDPIKSHSFLWLSTSLSQVAAASESASTTAPPPLVLVIDLSFPVGILSSARKLFSSFLSLGVSRCESFEFLIPSIKNCLALIPSLAAILGSACAGGFRVLFIELGLIQSWTTKKIRSASTVPFRSIRHKLFFFIKKNSDKSRKN
jgi:hypothetical protein